jgi:Ser/Thr protein kinase RdoA (MazF antagonist)
MALTLENERKILSVLDYFGITDAVEKMDPVENGHINHTFLVEAGGKKYIVQQINSYVFTRPQDIMENIEHVTAHIRKKLVKEGRDPQRGALSNLHNEKGCNYYLDEEQGFWRICPYIERTRTYEQVENLDMLYNAGYAFGQFQRMLSDYPMVQLHETIVDFHNTKKRMNDFFTVVAADCCGRAASVQEDIDFFVARREKAGAFTDMLEKGELPLRVTHNDTKYNNILIDSQNFEAVCVIDLDTVMPGLSMYDFGDAIRFAANTALEDETDLSRVGINMEYFEAFTKGFMSACQGAFTENEIANMAQGAIDITIELASRFLADHINGDKYFQIHRPNHNLERARNQMKLVTEMEKRLPEMNAIVRKYC